MKHRRHGGIFMTFYGRFDAFCLYALRGRKQAKSKKHVMEGNVSLRMV